MAGRRRPGAQPPEEGASPAAVIAEPLDGDARPRGPRGDTRGKSSRRRTERSTAASADSCSRRWFRPRFPSPLRLHPGLVDLGSACLWQRGAAGGVAGQYGRGGLRGRYGTGRVLFTNRAALLTLGYEDEDELLGRESHATIHSRHLGDGTPFPESECPLLRVCSDRRGGAGGAGLVRAPRRHVRRRSRTRRRRSWWIAHVALWWCSGTSVSEASPRPSAAGPRRSATPRGGGWWRRASRRQAVGQGSSHRRRAATVGQRDRCAPTRRATRPR